MQTIEVKPGDVVAVEGPDGVRHRQIVGTMTDFDGEKHYRLMDHCEGSAYYDDMLTENTVLVLRWAGGN